MAGTVIRIFRGPMFRMFAALMVLAWTVASGVVFGDSGGLLACVHEMKMANFGGLVIVPLELNGEIEIDFILDSGANQSTLNDPLLPQLLGVEMKAQGLVRGMGSGAALVGLTEDIRVAGGGLELFRIPFVVNDIGDRIEEEAGRRLDGMLGWELFENFVVEVDPRAQLIRLYEPESFRYSGNGEVLPLSVEDRRPVIEARVAIEGGKEISVRLLVDTGSARYLTLINKSKRRLRAPEGARQSRGLGVVGSSRMMLAKTRSLSLGALTTTDVDTAWTEHVHIPAARNINKIHGVLGNRMLGRFRCIFDYRGGRLILEPP